MARNVLTDSLTELLNGAATKIDIDAGDGSLTIDRIAGSERVLARGTMKCLERGPAQPGPGFEQRPGRPHWVAAG